MTDHKLVIIGITGGIGCGKSTLTKIFSQLGFPVLDADQVSRQVMLPPRHSLASQHSVYQEVVNLFGNDVIAADGTLDRNVIRHKIFSDLSLKTKLEKITHPAILRETQSQFQQWQANQAKLGFYEASLLIETERFKEFQGNILVISSTEIQQARLIRRGLAADEAKTIINHQMCTADKLKKLMHVTKLPHWIITNDADEKHLQYEASRVLLSIKNQFKC